MKIQEMTVRSLLDLATDTIRCSLIGKHQDQQITFSSLEISFDGIVSIDNIDYDKIIVKGFVKGERETYELWFDRERNKFTLCQ